MSATIGVVTFPGTLDDTDVMRAVRRAGGRAVEMWHDDAELRGADAVIIPGGFSYGDYLRAGAIARFAPAMRAVIESAKSGMPVLGICNGFQILCESGLLPGALIRNAGLHFICRDQRLRVDNVESAWTTGYSLGEEIIIPVKHMDGNYVADRRTIDELESTGRVVFRYLGKNPNGSMNDIAGITDESGRIVGLMPHPEHAIDQLTGPGTDGLSMFLPLLDKVISA